MDPWDEQDLHDHAIDRTGTSVDDDERLPTVLAWMSVVLGGIALVAALTAVRLLTSYDSDARTALTVVVVAAFTLVGCAVCAICSAVSAAELRIRRGR